LTMSLVATEYMKHLYLPFNSLPQHGDFDPSKYVPKRNKGNYKKGRGNRSDSLLAMGRI
jgi:hypothetical protein